MTLQGLDMEGRVTNWGRVKALGYAYSISRLVGENGAVDPDYAPNTAGALGVGIVPGGYHFIAHGTAAEHCKLFVDAMGDPHGKIVMLDAEIPNAHPKPTEADVGAWFNEYRKHVPLHTVVVYSRENYWMGIGDPKLGPNVVLMTSRYPGGSTYPGDGAYAWTERWGGLSPRFWQWKGSSSIGVGASVDFSAFKGTLAELQSIAGTDPPAPDTSTSEDLVRLASKIYRTAIVPLAGKPVLDAPGGTLIYTTKAGDQFGEEGDTGSYHVMRMPGDIAGYIAHGNVAPTVALPVPTGDTTHTVKLTVDGIEKASVTV